MLVGSLIEAVVVDDSVDPDAICLPTCFAEDRTTHINVDIRTVRRAYLRCPPDGSSRQAAFRGFPIVPVLAA